MIQDWRQFNYWVVMKKNIIGRIYYWVEILAFFEVVTVRKRKAKLV